MVLTRPCGHRDKKASTPTLRFAAIKAGKNGGKRPCQATWTPPLLRTGQNPHRKVSRSNRQGLPLRSEFPNPSRHVACQPASIEESPTSPALSGLVAMAASQSPVADQTFLDAAQRQTRQTCVVTNVPIDAMIQAYSCDECRYDRLGAGHERVNASDESKKPLQTSNED